MKGRQPRRGDRISLGREEATGTVLAVAPEGYGRDVALVKWDDGRETVVTRSSNQIEVLA